MSLEPTDVFAGDRLSDLPDVLLHAIVSFLPAQQVVRTSVLSRRWRNLWRSAPCINIGIYDFFRSGGDLRSWEERWRKLEDFTSNLLLFHNNITSLDKFRISTATVFRDLAGVWDVDALRVLDRWMRRGIQYCPQVLEILTPASPANPFPHMGASSCRLKRLKLDSMYLDNQFAELLFSGCPVLEDLKLMSCDLDFQEIKSRTLKKLVLQECDHAG